MTSKKFSVPLFSFRWAGDNWCYYLHSGTEAIRRPLGNNHLWDRGTFWSYRYFGLD